MNTLYYADEIQSFDEIAKGVRPSEDEIQMGIELVEQHSNEEAHLKKYEDPYRLKVLDLVESKVKGEKVEAAPVPKPRGQVVDLMEALKKSLAGGKVAREEKKEPAPARKMEKVFSFAEFKTLVDAAKLDVRGKPPQKLPRTRSVTKEKESLLGRDERKSARTRQRPSSRFAQKSRPAESRPDPGDG